MEPISMSLVAIGASSMALRRATRDDPNMLPFETEGLAAAGAALMGALSGCSLRPRPVVASGNRSMALQLARFASANGLQLNAQVSLDALFDAEGRTARFVSASLRQRRIDFALTDDNGTPVCGIEIVTAAHPGRGDSTRRVAFRKAGLPIVTLNAEDGWAPNRDRLAEALGLDLAPANSDAPHIPLASVS
ncbi:MAG: DUF2726 domain-containing protein [Pseudomonadota bacterium]